MWRIVKSPSSLTWLKVSVTASAVFCIIVRLIWPGLNIDAITLGLLVVAVLPWLSVLLESAEFPGGWKVKFRNLQNAGEQITGVPLPPREGSVPAPSYLSVAESDPNLALVGLRIEIEKRIREIASRHDIKERTLSGLLNALRHKHVLERSASHGLHELIRAGNNAAHGAPVEKDVYGWAFDFGPLVLAKLDEVLEDTGPKA